MDKSEIFFRLSHWLIRILWLLCLVHAVAIVSDMLEYSILEKIDAGDLDDELLSAAESNDFRQLIINRGGLAVFVAAGVLVLYWIYRANLHARHRGAIGMTFSPGWSVGWHFIPIMNLWKPFQAMVEIWAAGVGGVGWHSHEPPPIFRVWWALWLASWLFDRYAARTFDRAETAEELMYVSVLWIVSGVLGILLSISLIGVISEILDRHSRPIAEPRNST